MILGSFFSWVFKKIVLRIIIFFLAVWFFLGINPVEGFILSMEKTIDKVEMVQNALKGKKLVKLSKAQKEQFNQKKQTAPEIKANPEEKTIDTKEADIKDQETKEENVGALENNPDSQKEEIKKNELEAPVPQEPEAAPVPRPVETEIIETLESEEDIRGYPSAEAEMVRQEAEKRAKELAKEAELKQKELAEKEQQLQQEMDKDIETVNATAEIPAVEAPKVANENMPVPANAIENGVVQAQEQIMDSKNQVNEKIENEKAASQNVVDEAKAIPEAVIPQNTQP